MVGPLAERVVVPGLAPGSAVILAPLAARDVGDGLLSAAHSSAPMAVAGSFVARLVVAGLLSVACGSAPMVGSLVAWVGTAGLLSVAGALALVYVLLEVVAGLAGTLAERVVVAGLLSVADALTLLVMITPVRACVALGRFTELRDGDGGGSIDSARQESIDFLKPSGSSRSWRYNAGLVDGW